MGPGLYSDVGKIPRDFLFKDYQLDQKFTLTTYSTTGAILTTSAIKKGELFFCDTNTRLEHKNISADVKVDTSSNLFTTITVDELIPGLKTALSYRAFDQRSAKVELNYLNDYAGITTSLGLTPNPPVNFSGAFGNEKFAVGGDLSFDMTGGALTKCNIGANYTDADLVASMTLHDKFDTLTNSFYHYTSPSNNTAFGAEASYTISTNVNKFTFGARQVLDPSTTFKVRMDNFGMAGVLIQHEWRPNSYVTVSAELDTLAINKGFKIGMALAQVVKP